MPKKYPREVRELSNCPNCNEKLSPFYFKQNCPHCGANLMYYDFENRLQQDAEKVAREVENSARLMKGIKNSTIGSVTAVIRLISFLLPIVALLLPIFRVNTENITLISMIKQLIADSGVIFENTALLLCLVDFAVIVVFALVSLIASLFSFTKNGLKRNVAITECGAFLFAVVYIAVISTGGGIAYGFFVIVVLEMLIAALHFSVNKILKNS